MNSLVASKRPTDEPRHDETVLENVPRRPLHLGELVRIYDDVPLLGDSFVWLLALIALSDNAHDLA